MPSDRLPLHVLSAHNVNQNKGKVNLSQFIYKPDNCASMSKAAIPPSRRLKPHDSPTKQVLRSGSQTPAANSKASRSNLAASNTNTASKHAHSNTSSHQRLQVNLKRQRELVDLIFDAEENDTPHFSNKKRVRTIAAPTKMGAKVSQLVNGYESKSAATTEGPSHRRGTVASSAKLNTTCLNNSSSTRSTKSLLSFHRNDTPTALHLVRRDSFRAACNSLPHEKVQGCRYFECSRCCMASVYDINLDATNKLVCEACNHRFCCDCVLDGVGKAEEVCVEQPWHGEKWKGEYWMWRQEMEANGVDERAQ